MLRMFTKAWGRIVGVVAATGMLANLASLTGQIIAAGALSLAVGVTPAHAVVCSWSPASATATLTFTAATMGTDQSVVAPTLTNECAATTGNVYAAGAYCGYVIFSGGNILTNSNNASYALPINLNMKYGPMSQNLFQLNPIYGQHYTYFDNQFGTFAPWPISASITKALTVSIAASSTISLPNPGTYSNVYSYDYSFGYASTSVDACNTWPNPQLNNVTFNVVIPPICNVSSVTNVIFGAISSLATRQDATGSIAVACSQGIPYTIYLGDGNQRQSVGSGLRQMANINSASNVLPYQLYKDSGRTTVWDATGGVSSVGGSGGVSGTGTGTAVNTPVYASIPAGTSPLPAPGGYVDNVVITVAY